MRQQAMAAADRVPLVESPYLKKLVQEVHRKLRKALDTPSQRRELLHQLFTDIALEVDSRAQVRLYRSERIRPGERALCFYEVLAEHYGRIPEDAKEVLPLFAKLWSQSLAAQIFTLLFYEWLFKGPAEDLDGYVRYSTAFIEGASAIFWIDLQSNVRLFSSMYQYTLREVAMNRERHGRIRIQDRRQIVLIMARFFFFYAPDTSLEDFLAHFPTFSMSLGAADVFVIELTDQLQKVKVELVLLQYLEGAKCLKGVQLRVPTSNRLRTALYGFTSPGGPMYPTRAVRHAAWETLDCLFPVGRNSRHLISLLFRMMHPFYWPISFWNFVVISFAHIVQRIYRIVQRIYLFLLSICEWVLGPRRVPRR